jgi:phage tail-like protein
MSNLQINFRDFLPEASIVNRDRKEIIRKIMDAYQENYDLIDGEIDGLLTITDVDDAPEEYLDYIAALVGMELLGLDTAEQKRALIKNAVAIYKVKGTAESWQIMFKSLGFETDITELWWDNVGDLVDVDPMLGHLNQGNSNIISSISVSEVNSLPPPTLSDSYLMEDAGVVNPGAVTVAAGDVIDFDGANWVNLGIPFDPINPALTLLGRFTVAEFNNPVLNPLGRLSAAEIAALQNPTTGDTYEVEDSGIINPGALSVVGDDIIQWDGAAWILVPHYKTIDELTNDVTRPTPFDGAFASVTINDITFPGPLETLTVVAGDVGVWGNDIDIVIEDGTDPLVDFNLVVLFDSVEVARFDDLSKDLNLPVDNIEVAVNTETFYIDVSSISTFGTEKRPLSGTYPLINGLPPRNTKSPYIDIILSAEFLTCTVDAILANKAAFFDGRIKEVKPAHIRIRAKRVAISFVCPADLAMDDSDLTAFVTAEIVDILQPSCDPPPGAIMVFFHNGFIRGRSGLFTRGHSLSFPNGIPNDPGAVGGGAGYVYAYDGLDVGSHGLTYGDTQDSLFNPFQYGFVFDPNVCATDTLEVSISGTGAALQDDTFYGVSIPARLTYNNVFAFDGYMPFNSSPIDPATVDGDPTDNADPQGGVTVVRCLPATNQCVTELDWKFSDT